MGALKQGENNFGDVDVVDVSASYGVISHSGFLKEIGICAFGEEGDEGICVIAS